MTEYTNLIERQGRELQALVEKQKKELASFEAAQEVERYLPFDPICHWYVHIIPLYGRAGSLKIRTDKLPTNIDTVREAMKALPPTGLERIKPKQYAGTFCYLSEEYPYEITSRTSCICPFFITADPNDFSRTLTFEWFTKLPNGKVFAVEIPLTYYCQVAVDEWRVIGGRYGVSMNLPSPNSPGTSLKLNLPGTCWSNMPRGGSDSKGRTQFWWESQSIAEEVLAAFEEKTK